MGAGGTRPKGPGTDQGDGPRWRRRKEARPAEIIEAAMAVFADKGFAAARLDDIAARAGVSKGALYLYFETKQELFEAVVREQVAPNLDRVAEAAAAASQAPVAMLLPMLLARVADVISTGPIAPVAKMVIGESRNFPELARVWHDQLIDRAIGIVSGVIAAAQARGEVKPGDPRLIAFGIAGPMVMGALFREVFAPIGAPELDMRALAAQHAQTVLHGLLTEGAPS